MSRDQPWNLSGFNPQSSGGVQMFDPSRFQASATASLADGVAPTQKMFSPGQFQQQQQQQPAAGVPNSLDSSVHNHFPATTSEGSGFANTGQSALGWPNGNQWQGGDSTQQGQSFLDPSSQGQNFFSSGDSQQWQSWNTQQGQWDVTAQQQQQHPHQHQPQQAVNQSQWSQANDPVWTEPEPWLNENGSWGGQPPAAETQAQGSSGMQNQMGGQYHNSSVGGAYHNQGQVDVTAGSNQQYAGQPAGDSLPSPPGPFNYGSADTGWGGHSQSLGQPALYNNPTQPPPSGPHQGTTGVNAVTGGRYAGHQASESLSPGTDTLTTNVITEDFSQNDSGTVSSFFGSDDTYDAEPPSNTAGTSTLALNPPANPAMLRLPSFNRTASEISNSSLVTYHNSSLESLDGADGSQDVVGLSSQLLAASIQDRETVAELSAGVMEGQQRAPSQQPQQSSASGESVAQKTPPQQQMHSDSHSLSSHHSGDSLGNSANQSSFGGHSHHSSLDSSDLGLGSGFSSGPGTPGRPAVDLSAGPPPQFEHTPDHNRGPLSHFTGDFQHMHANPSISDPGLGSGSAKRNLTESLQGSDPPDRVDHVPMFGSGGSVGGHEAPASSSSPAATSWNPSQRGSFGNTTAQQHQGPSSVNAGSSSIQEAPHYESSSSSTTQAVSSDPHSALDTSGSSSLNASSDTIVMRPSSAFKPVRSPITSRQNSSSSNPGELGVAGRKPPRPPSEGRELGHNPHRPHSRQKHRNDNNISPATTLWAPPESSLHAPVILAPAAPSPLASPTHKTKPVPALSTENNKKSDLGVNSNTAVSTDFKPPSEESKTRESTSTRLPVKKETDIKETPRREDPYDKKNNSSYDDTKPRRKPKHRRQTSRDAAALAETKEGRDTSDRPPSRNDSLKDEYIDSRYEDTHYRDHYGYRSRDARRGYDEEYDRPRSRQDEERRPRSRADYDRPRSRTDFDRPRSRTDYDRPRSRTDYDRPRSRADYDYYDRDYRSRYKGYDYDQYYRHGYYYDRDYYDYHQNRYAMGYYDEYYRQAYDDRYPAGYYQESVATYDDTDQVSQTSAQSRGHTPADEIDQQSVRDHHGYGSRPHSRQHQYGHYDDQAYANASYDNMAYGYGYHGYNYGAYGEYQAKPEAVAKFSLPHVGVRFGPGGQLIMIQPHRPAEGQPAMVQVHELQELLHDDEEAEEIEEFPGPLIKGETHKNDVLVFCQRRARDCKDDIDMIDRDSAELLWKFLELLIKQNGTVVGTDISDLLLEGHEPTTSEYKSSGVKISTSQSQSLENLADIGEDETEKTLTVVADRSLVNRRKSLSVEEVTDRFRHLLLYGRKKDSLDWAMKHNLWGHALFLASKMDTRAHANVMIRFANSSMRMNDPLQTLYQLMSGRQPAAVTCISDERWGDWRPHLAMILSNHTPKPDVDRKSIITLGDTLASRGYLHASHFCYLMAQVGFGTYSKKSSKVVLVGSSHNLPFDEFATNHAIQCTEVYEYALTLGNPLSTLASFQPYKFMYACRMAEFGFTQGALHYCEVIAGTVNQAPGLYQVSFVKQLYELSSRLKYSDPQRQELGFEGEDPYWLQQLHRACQGLEDGSIQPISGSATPLGYGTTTGSSESGEIAGLTSAAEMTYGQYPEATAEGEGGYQQGYTAEHWGQQQQQYQQYGQEESDTTGQADPSQYAQYTGGEAQQQADPNYTNQAYNNNQYNQGYNYGYQQADGSYSYAGQTGYEATDKRYSQDSSAPSDSGFVGDPTTFGARRYSISGVPEEAPKDETDSISTAAPGTDYWGASVSNKVYGAPVRQRSTSGGSSLSSGRPRTLSGSSTHSVKASPYINKPPQAIQPMNTAGKEKKVHKQNGAGGKGILSYIASKLPFSTPKNEMKLPKDENPSIIWDPVKNRWVNTDGDEEPETPAAPPPKDSEMKGPSAPGMMAPPGGNRFQKPTSRGARSRYVDVLNPGSTTTASTSAGVPTSLFNVMPTTTAAPQNIFTPGTAAGANPTTPAVTEPSAAPAPSATPNLSVGNQHSRSSSLSSLSREVQQFTQQAIAQAEQDAQQAAPPNPGGVPMMFNPSQFSQSQQNFSQSASASSSSGPRYGQRRQYPKRN